MAETPETADDSRNPALNDPETMTEVAARTDEAQGFEVLDPLPGEEDADDGYESALTGESPAEPAADSDALDKLDVEAGLARPYTAATDTENPGDT